MSKRRTSSTSPISSCSACGARINVAGSGVSQKVQCPQCRQIIELEKPVAPQQESIPEPLAPAAETAALPEAQEERIAILEARVSDLERILADLVQVPAKVDALRKVKWIAADASPDYSTVQAEVLGHNLRTIRTHAIRIQFPCGDTVARTRAEWFTDIFARAQWRVRGPENTQRERLPASGLALATSLPVSPEAAATYLAIRAAGFPLATIYDRDLRNSEERLIVA